MFTAPKTNIENAVRSRLRELLLRREPGTAFLEPYVIQSKLQRCPSPAGEEYLWKREPVLLVRRNKGLKGTVWTISAPDGSETEQYLETPTGKERIMATGKKVLLIFTDVDAETLKTSEEAGLVKARQKGTLVPLTVKADLKAEAASGNTAGGQSLWEAATAEGFVMADMTPGTDITVVDARSAAEISAALEQGYEIGSKKLLAVVACPTLAIFYGVGVERGLSLDKPLPAACIAPTVAWLADFPLPAAVEAAPAYALIKGLNFKMREVHKLSDTVESMMTAMERANRKPWDKHDCA